MKIFKKGVATILCFMMMVSLVGCAKQAAEKNSEKKGNEEKVSFPERDITMIIPTETGGGSDVIARYLATEVGDELGVSVVPQNIGGAATATAFQQFMKADADGYTIIMSLSSLATMKSNNYADITYEDMEQICAVNYDSNVIFIRPDEDRYTNIEEFVEYCKAHPGEVNIGTGSAGGVAHVAITDFCAKADLEVNLVPNTSGGGFDLLLKNGDVDAIVCGPIDIASAVAADEVKLICTMTEERLPDFPDVPTAKETGIDATVAMYRGYHAPKGTPEGVIDALEEAFKKVVESDDYKKFLADQFSNDVFLDSEEWTEKCKSEFEIMPKVYEDAGITVGQ